MNNAELEHKITQMKGEITELKRGMALVKNQMKNQWLAIELLKTSTDDLEMKK